MKNSRRTHRALATALLGGLPLAAYADGVDIGGILQMMGWLALGGVVALGLLIVCFRALARVARQEQQLAEPARPAVRRVLWVALLALPLTTGWLALLLGRGGPVVGGVLFLLTLGALLIHLRRTGRTVVATGVGLSAAVLLAALGLGLAGVLLQERADDAEELAALTVPTGPDATKVYDAPGQLAPATPAPEPDATTVHDEAEQMPEFPGGPGALPEFIRQNVRYPLLPVADRRRGTVGLSYVVGVDGAVLDVRVTQSLGPAFDDEAVRLLEQLPRFRPGRRQQQVVAVRCTIAVAFEPPPVAEAWQ